MRFTYVGWLSFFLLAGCVTSVVAPYPEDWPLSDSMGVSDCKDASGTYYLSAEKVAGKDMHQSSHRLDNVLFAKTLNEYSPSGTVNFSYSSADNSVTLSLSPTVSAKKRGYTHLQGTATCKEGWINVNTEMSSHSEGTTSFYKSFAKIKRTLDGNLIVNLHSAQTSRTFLFLIVRQEKESWYIFERAK